MMCSTAVTLSFQRIHIRKCHRCATEVSLTGVEGFLLLAKFFAGSFTSLDGHLGSNNMVEKADLDANKQVRL